MNRNKLKDFISWLIQISFEGYSKEKQIEHLIALSVDARINHEEFNALVKTVNDCSYPAVSAIEELVRNSAKWTKVYMARYLRQIFEDDVLDQYLTGDTKKNFINILFYTDTNHRSHPTIGWNLRQAYANISLRRAFVRYLIDNGYGTVELRDLCYINIVRDSLALNAVSGAYGEIDHPLLIDTSFYPVNRNSPDKDKITLRWTEKYPKVDFDRYQKAVNDWIHGLRKLAKDDEPLPRDPAYSLKLPNHGVSGSFVHINDIKAARHELDRTNTGWLFNPKLHEPIGSRYVDIYRQNTNKFLIDLHKTTKQAWNIMLESGELPESKAYLKKNRRGKPTIAKKKHKPSGLLKALVAKKD